MGKRPDYRAELLAAGTERLRAFKLADAMRITPAEVARAVGCKQDVVSSHFRGPDTVQSWPGALAAHLLQPIEPPVIEPDSTMSRPREIWADIARQLGDELEGYSPSGGKPFADAAADVSEMAFFLTVATARNDKSAAGLAAAYCRPVTQMYRSMVDELRRLTKREWRNDMTDEKFATLTGALCDGFIWVRRFDPASAPVELYVSAWEHLFESCTRPVGRIEDGDHRDEIFAGSEELPELPATEENTQLRDRLVRAAVAVTRREGYLRSTVGLAAAEAGVDREMARIFFPYKRDMAAAQWSRHLPHLVETVAAREGKPLEVQVNRFLHSLSSFADDDRLAAADFLKSVFAFTVGKGAPDGNLRDPRVLVPLPSLLVPIIAANAAEFRPGYAGTLEEQRDSAAELVNMTLHLTMTRPTWDAERVASRVCDCLLRGMLKTSVDEAEN